jgi:hypothetical protein
VGIPNLGGQAVKGYAEVQIRDQKNGPPRPGGKKAQATLLYQCKPRSCIELGNNEPHRSRTALRSSLVREVSELQVDLMCNGGPKRGGRGQGHLQGPDVSSAAPLS